MSRPDLFAYTKALAGSSLRPKLQMFGVLLAQDGRAVTAQEITVDASSLAAVVGCSERTVWNLVRELVEAGWLEQTGRPSRGAQNRPGTKARYGARVPETCATGTADDCIRLSTEPSEALEPNDCTRLAESSASSAESSANTGGFICNDDARNLHSPASYGSTRSSFAEVMADFWRLYPRTVGVDKSKAEMALRKALETTDPDVILAALRRQLPVLKAPEPLRRRHPHTWLAERRWEDADPPQLGGSSSWDRSIEVGSSEWEARYV